MTTFITCLYINILQTLSLILLSKIQKLEFFNIFYFKYNIWNDFHLNTKTWNFKYFLFEKQYFSFKKVFFKKNQIKTKNILTWNMIITKKLSRRLKPNQTPLEKHPLKQWVLVCVTVGIKEFLCVSNYAITQLWTDKRQSMIKWREHS